MKKVFAILAFCMLGLLFLGCSINSQNNEDDGKNNVTSIIKLPTDIPYVSYNNPTIVDDEMYISVGETRGTVDRVIDYNIKTKDIKVIFNSQFSDAAVQGTMANLDWVVWIDADAAGYNNIIYAFDRSSNEVVKIKQYQAVDNGYMIVAPYLSGDTIAWLEFREKDIAKVVVFNLITSELKYVDQLDEPNFYNTFVNIDGDQVLWTDSIDGQGYYCIYNTKTEKIQKIKAPYPYPGYAKMTDDLIYSINFNDYHNWLDQDFGSFTISTSTYRTALSEDEPYINQFRLKGRILAVMDNNNVMKLIDIKTGKELSYESPLKTIDSIDISEGGEVIAGVETMDNVGAILVVVDCSENSKIWNTSAME